MHETAKATAALEGFASSANPLWPFGDKAGFWLGAGRGHDGLLALEKLASDPDPEFRKKLAFDISVNHDPAAIDALIRMAKSKDADTGVREQAIFWVAQKAGAKAVATLKDAVENDPRGGGKEKGGVRAEPIAEGPGAVPELLQVAQTNRDLRGSQRCDFAGSAKRCDPQATRSCSSANTLNTRGRTGSPTGRALLFLFPTPSSVIDQSVEIRKLLEFANQQSADVWWSGVRMNQEWRK